MDQEVAKTLGELELKLQQLERELTSIGPGDNPADHAGHVDAPGGDDRAQTAKAQPSGRLVDEAMEPDASESILTESEDGLGGPVVFGGEEVPAQGGATIGQPWTTDVSETAYGEIPRPPTPSPGGLPVAPVPSSPGPPIPPPGPPPQPPPTTPPGPPRPETPPTPTPMPDPQPIDRAELVLFKRRLEQTMTDLSDELARLLAPEPPT